MHISDTVITVINNKYDLKKTLLTWNCIDIEIDIEIELYTWNCL